MATGKAPGRRRLYRYRLDRRSKRITTLVIVLIVGGFAAFRFLVAGTYVSAWFLFFALAVLGLYILSIPRFIRIGNEMIEIRCLVESTYIPFSELRSVRRMDHDEVKFTFPLLGSYGFFGYYGYYYDLRRLEMVKVYASKWRNFVELEDIYEQKYIVSADDPETLMETILEVREHGRRVRAPKA